MQQRRADAQTTRRIPRRRRGAVRIVALSAVCVWFGLVCFSLLSYYSAASKARDAVQGVSVVSIADDSTELTVASAELRYASARIDDPWLWPLTVVPGIGHQINAAEGITAAARQTVEIALSGSETLDSLTSNSSGSSAQQLGSVSSELSAMRAELGAIQVPDSDLLLGPIGDLRDDFVADLLAAEAELGSYADLAGGLVALTESEGHWLVVAANNGEMGLGTGMTLSVARASFGGGGIDLTDFSSVGGLRRGTGVVVDQDLAQRWATFEPGHHWNYAASVTQRIPEVGQMLVDMWHSRDGAPVQGVIILDAVAMTGMLEAADISEIQLDGRSIPVTGLGEWLALGQYELLEPGADGAAGASNDDRRAAISSVAAASLRALLTSETRPVQMADGLMESIAGRHFLAWSADPSTQSAIVAAGMDGDLHANSLAFGVSNLGGNKLDSFVHVETNLETVSTGSDDGSWVIEGTVTVTNTVTDDVPNYVAGQWRGRPRGQYRGFLVMNVPSSALVAELEGETPVWAAGPDGVSFQVAQNIELLAGESVSFDIRLVLLSTMMSLVFEPSGRSPAMLRTFNGLDVPDMRTQVTKATTATSSGRGEKE